MIGSGGLNAGIAVATDGLLTVISKVGPQETLRRLESAIIARGMTVFARVDHAAGARDVHMDLRPTDLLIFGSPKAGTPLMQADQTVGIDLPLRALVFQDAEQRTVIALDDPEWIARRHGLSEAAAPITAKMKSLLREVAAEAAATG
jgi:uncharacterized protein (DUF302 family)